MSGVIMPEPKTFVAPLLARISVELFFRDDAARDARPSTPKRSRLVRKVIASRMNDKRSTQNIGQPQSGGDE